MDGTSHELDIQTLALRYGRDLAAAAYSVLENKAAAEQAAAAGIADVLRSRGGSTLQDAPDLQRELTDATLRRAHTARQTAREVDPHPDLADRGAIPSLGISTDAIEAALAAQPARRHAWSRRSIVAALLILVGITAAMFWQMPSASRDLTARNSARGVPASSSAARQTSHLPIALGDELTLAGCGIEPAETPLAYRGWIALEDLSPPSEPTSEGTRVYALVTDGDAEWIGWRQPGEARAMYPKPVGRLACAVDPAHGTMVVYAIPSAWQPPRRVEGCATSGNRRWRIPQDWRPTPDRGAPDRWPGCWGLSVVVDGEVVGAAVLPIAGPA